MAEALPALHFPITGDAAGAIAAINAAAKKVEELKGKEESLQKAMAAVNKDTAEGAQLFGLLKAQLDKLEDQTVKFNVASDNTKNISKELNDRVGKFSSTVSALAPVVGNSGGKIAEMANAGAGLAQAFAAGGPLIAGIAAAGIVLGKLNEAIGTYIDNVSNAETASLAASAKLIADASSLSRIAAADFAVDAETKLSSLQKKLSDLDIEIAKVGKQFGEMAAKDAASALLPDERARMNALQKSLIDAGNRRQQIIGQIQEENRLLEDGVRAREKAAAHEAKQLADAAARLRLERARAGLAAGNLPSTDMPPTPGADPYADIFGPRAFNQDELDFLNRYVGGAPSAGPGAGVIEGAISIEELAKELEVPIAKFSTAGDRFAQALASFPPNLISALSGDASSLGGIGSIVGGAVGGPVGGAVGGALGATLGDGLSRLIEKLNPFGEVISSISDVMMSLEPIWVITATNANALAGAFDALGGVVRIGAEILALLQVPLRVIGQVFTDLGPDMEDTSDSLIDFADKINQAARFFAGGIADVINAMIDAINFIIRQLNERFGTDIDTLSKVVVADMFGVAEAASDAGDSIRENLTDEFANLPAGFKTNGAIFAATDAIGGGSSSGVNIGTINITARGSVMDEVSSLTRRAQTGSSGILGGRSSVPDRRN